MKVKRTRANPTMSRRLAVNAAASPENYISYHMNNFAIGINSGASPPSIAFNDYILNNGAHIALGTGTNLRVGKHIYFTFLRLRLQFAVATGSEVRIIIAKRAKQELFANSTSNAALAALVEGELIEAPLYGSNQNTSCHFIAPSTEYQVLLDKRIGYCTEPFTENAQVLGSTSICTNSALNIDLPLNLQRMYNASNTVDQGDFVVWFCAQNYLASTTSAATIAAQTHGIGEMRLEYINQFDWESIPRAIKGTISAADDVFKHASNSDFVKTLLTLIKGATLLA